MKSDRENEEEEEEEEEFSLFRPYVVFAQCNNTLITFGLPLFCTISPLIRNAILTRLSVEGNQRTVPCPAFIG